MTGWIVVAVLVAWVVVVHRRANKRRYARLVEAAGALRDDGLQVAFRSVGYYVRQGLEDGIPAPWAYGGPKPAIDARVVEVVHDRGSNVTTTWYWRLEDDGEAAAYLAGVQAGIELAR